ncbi:MAG: hypothetical protein JW997_01350 [Actinobacteria bacterium]|nr:hypothetical protein [Actinomycetota bacterium]
MELELEFDHIGLKTDEKKEDENWVESTRVWVTDPKTHPFHIEWLRYEPDSPVKGDLREKPHIAYRVKDLQQASKGLEALLEPFEVGGFVRAGFYKTKDGAVVELMQYLKGENMWFDKKH